MVKKEDFTTTSQYEIVNKPLKSAPMGIDWKPRLYSEHGDKYIIKDVEQYTSDHFIICLQKEYRHYANFGTVKNFANHLYSWSCKGLPLNCYEIISGLRPAKFYFDVDAKDLQSVAELLLEQLLQSVADNWSQVCSSPLDWNQVFIYNSHSIRRLSKKQTVTSGASDVLGAASADAVFDASADVECGKKSWHIVFNQLITPNCHAARYVADKLSSSFLTEDEDEVRKRFLDKGVYKSTQQFRFVHCHKWGSNRVKVLERNWHYGKFSGKYSNYVDNLPTDIEGINHDKLEFMSVFLDSCISNVQGRKANAIIPSDLTVLVRPKYNFVADDFPDIDLPDGFSVYKSDGDKVVLQREFPSYCSVCDKEHEQQGAFLIWDRFKRTIYYHCYRALETGVHPSFNIYTTITNYVDYDEMLMLTDDADVGVRSKTNSSTAGVCDVTTSSNSNKCSSDSKNDSDSDHSDQNDHPDQDDQDDDIPDSIRVRPGQDKGKKVVISSQTTVSTKRATACNVVVNQTTANRTVTPSATIRTISDVTTNQVATGVTPTTVNKKKSPKLPLVLAQPIAVEQMQRYSPDVDNIFNNDKPSSEVSEADKTYIIPLDEVTQQAKMDRVEHKRQVATRHANSLYTPNHADIIKLSSRDHRQFLNQPRPPLLRSRVVPSDK